MSAPSEEFDAVLGEAPSLTNPQVALLAAVIRQQQYNVKVDSRLLANDYLDWLNSNGQVDA